MIRTRFNISDHISPDWQPGPLLDDSIGAEYTDLDWLDFLVVRNRSHQIPHDSCTRIHKDRSVRESDKVTMATADYLTDCASNQENII